jgi:hypothetical protein
MLGRIASVFVERVDETSEDAPNPRPSRSGTADAVATVSNVATVRSTVPVRAVNQKLVEGLRESVAKSTEVGYSDFMTFVESLADVVIDEAQRYKAALKVAAKTKALTLQRIIKSFEDRLRLLKREKSRFEETLEAQFAAKVGAKQAQLKNAEEQIQALKSQLDDLEASSDVLRKEIDAEQDGIADVTSDFEAAYAVVEAEIETALNKVQQHLGQ